MIWPKGCNGNGSGIVLGDLQVTYGIADGVTYRDAR